MRIIKTKEGILLKARLILKGAVIKNSQGECITSVMLVDKSLILYTEVIKNNKVINSEITPISNKCDIILNNLNKHRIKYAYNDLVSFDWNAFNDENDIE